MHKPKNKIERKQNMFMIHKCPLTSHITPMWSSSSNSKVKVTRPNIKVPLAIASGLSFRTFGKQPRKY
jgi:hypothetical protein